jgi:hypothetical protein
MRNETLYVCLCLCMHCVRVCVQAAEMQALQSQISDWGEYETCLCVPAPVYALREGLCLGSRVRL